MKQYIFTDEWDVDAPIESVFYALADSRSYPQWWKPVYIKVDADGAPKVGCVAHHYFKGRLPYQLMLTSRISRIDPPRLIETEVSGDLSGQGRWTLSEYGDKVHVRFDWMVNPNRPFLKILTPLLKPIFRWNHEWAVARAKEGLEPFSRRKKNDV